MSTNRCMIVAAAMATLVGTAFGQFSFSGPDVYDTPEGPAGVAVGDFDGVNGPDFAVVNINPDKISIMYNTGEGTFTGLYVIQMGVNVEPRHVIALDANGDGILDLAVASQRSSGVYLYHGLGDGSFFLADFVNVGINPRFLIARDFNSDGMMDIASANSVGNSVTVLLNNGAGFDGTSYAAGVDPYALTSGDFNNDGIMDIAVSNKRALEVTLLAGNGAGVFTPMDTLSVISSPDGIVAADLDGDGDDDLAVASEMPGYITVYLNAGGFDASMFYSITGSGLGGLAVGDLDDDGDMDLIGINANSNSMALLANNGDGTFNAPQSVPLGARPDRAVVADLGGSSALDIIVTNRDSNTTMVFLNNALGDCAADFNGDGVVDTQDVLSFLNAWSAGDPSADVNGDGSVDTLDVLVFLNSWAAGC